MRLPLGGRCACRPLLRGWPCAPARPPRHTGGQLALARYHRSGARSYSLCALLFSSKFIHVMLPLEHPSLNRFQFDIFAARGRPISTVVPNGDRQSALTTWRYCFTASILVSFRFSGCCGSGGLAALG